MSIGQKRFIRVGLLSAGAGFRPNRLSMPPAIPRPSVPGFADFQTTCLDFGGVSSGEGMMSPNTAVAQGLAGPLSVVAWVNASDISATQIVWTARIHFSSANRMDFGISSGGDVFYQRWDSAGTLRFTSNSDAPWLFGGWHMMGFTTDGSSGPTQHEFYIDGVAVGGTAITDTSGSGYTDTLRRSTCSGAPENANPPTLISGTEVDGNLLYVANWNAELSAADMLAIYNHGWGGEFDITTDLGGYTNSAANQHWWRLGDVQGSDANRGADSGNGTTMTLTNNFNITGADEVTDSPVGVTF